MIKAIVVGCMDYRFQKDLANLILNKGFQYGEYDLVLVEGGAGNFEQLEIHLKIAKTLHNPGQIVLTIHEDCSYKSRINDFHPAIQICRDIFGTTVKVSTHFLAL